LIEIAQHIRAHVILIDSSSLDEARKAREHVFVPVAAAGVFGSAMVGGGDLLTTGAGESRSKTNEQTRERGYLVCNEAQEPKAGTLLPPSDVNPARRARRRRPHSILCRGGRLRVQDRDV
jgi:hypothetical protein